MMNLKGFGQRRWCRNWGDLPGGIEGTHGMLQTEWPESQARYPRTRDLDKCTCVRIKKLTHTLDT